MEPQEAGSLSAIRGSWGPERAGVRRTVKPGKPHKQEIIFHKNAEEAFNVEDKANRLTEFELQECKAAFDALDATEKGTIGTEELDKVIKMLGLEPSLTEVQDLKLEKQSERGCGEIAFTEFLNLVAKIRREREDEDLREAFFMLDSQHTGSIGKNEVKQVMAGLGHTLTDEQAIGMIREADTTGDGRISFQETVTRV